MLEIEARLTVRRQTGLPDQVIAISRIETPELKEDILGAKTELTKKKKKSWHIAWSLNRFFSA